MQLMETENKTEVTAADLKTILDFHNAANALLENLQETFSCTMEQALALHKMQHKVQKLFEFKPIESEYGSPLHKDDFVLKTDKRAYWSEYELEKLAKAKKESEL